LPSVEITTTVKRIGETLERGRDLVKAAKGLK
jgi:hypothetical protein